MILRGEARPTRRAPNRASRRALVAGCVGNLVEWYDFALFGAFASVIAATFFPGQDPSAGLLATFTVFGVAFLARPAGALLFANWGDRQGRRRPLAAGILLMGLVTAGIGVLPGPALRAWGWRVPFLLALPLGLVALLVVTMPAFRLIQRGTVGALVSGYAVMGLALGVVALSAFLAELFPTRLRYSGLSLTFGLTSALFGGTAPALATVLAGRAGSPSGAAWYTGAVTAVAAVCLLLAPETTHRTHDDL
jgi:MFS family permease